VFLVLNFFYIIKAFQQIPLENNVTQTLMMDSTTNITILHWHWEKINKQNQKEFGVLVLWRLENQRNWRKTLTAR